MSNDDVLRDLSNSIAKGLPGPTGGFKPLLERLFGSRFHRRHFSLTGIRDAYALAARDDEGGVPFAGMVHPDSPPTGAYGGTSIVWFPTSEHGSLIDFGVGTRGLAPDEGILTRPGHRRRIAALRRYLARHGIESWSKPDPAALGVSVPKTTRDRFPGFEHVFQRYGAELYCCAGVPPDDPDKTRLVVQSFVDLYAYERGWQVMKTWESEFSAFHAALRDDLFPCVQADDVYALLKQRRFVVLQGPPGTGKTRLANEIRRRFFDARGLSVQFHPAVTYEDFIVGLSPDAKERTLRFDVRPGWLIEAANAANSGPFLLVIDEINRADLGKVLGEAIYLFEADEIGGANARSVRLPHPIKGVQELSLPTNLYVLATMNTADRSIAGMDLAIRRRFAFMTMPPDRKVVAECGLPLATRAFDMISDVFVEHAPGDALDLLPGHAYFLATSEDELRKRFRYELVPLLDEYIHQGFLGPAATELHAVRDAIEDLIDS